MQSNQKQQQTNKPPSLLRGLFTIVLAITSTILLSAGAIINYQVEQLVAYRTSEYAHSIAKIAANFSAEALMAEDELQLKMLVENVAKDPHIQSATIFAEDGQEIARFPEIELAANLEIENQELAYLSRENNLPFVEKITYQSVTAGWFKIVIDRNKLEKSFRLSLAQSKNIIILVTLVLLILLISIIYRFERNIKKLVSYTHRMIQLNAAKVPFGKIQWMQTIKELSETQFYRLAESKQLPEQTSPWLTSQRVNDTVFCYCQFAMQAQEDEKTAETLTLAEFYLQSAIQTHGLHSQGDILSGCLIPLFDNQDTTEGLNEVVGLLHLIKELLASLTLPITMRAFIGSANILTLENERAEISGVSLSNRMADKINKLSSQISFGQIVSLNFEPEQLEKITTIKPIENSLAFNAFQLTQVKDSIEQQVNRQISYIKTNKSAE